MRCIVVALALARTQQVPMSMPMPRAGFLERVLMHAGVPAPIENYEGSFYGVAARVELNMRTRVAQIHLSGAPLGGRISGTGWLSNPNEESGTVVLEHAFERRLSRRFVTIYGASLNREMHTVTVHVKLPVVGTLELTLK